MKGVGGFYYVHPHQNVIDKNKTYECKAKGAFRNQGVKPAVGDDVEIQILDKEKCLGNITEIYPRKNKLLRPMVANVDQAMLVFALADPTPNFNLVDRFLIMMDRQDVETILILNKSDLVSEEEANRIKSIYEACGYQVYITIASAKKDSDRELSEQSVKQIRELVLGKTTVLAGPSGVGKSSLLNALSPEVEVKTGEISEKIKRGKHTTRHSELMFVYDENVDDTYIMDTPGFSSLMVDEMEPEDLKDYYSEFEPYREDCRFNGCLHLSEPDCMVKKALEEGKISELRYNNYKQMYGELKERRKW